MLRIRTADSPSALPSDRSSIATISASLPGYALVPLCTSAMAGKLYQHCGSGAWLAGCQLRRCRLGSFRFRCTLGGAFQQQIALTGVKRKRCCALELDAGLLDTTELL